MRLLYCYVQFLNDHGLPVSYRGLEKIELNFSAVDKFSYDPQTNTVERKARCCSLPEDFWLNDPTGSEKTTNIYNINVISGENGSGKTTAIHYLIDLLDGIHAAADPAVKDRNRMEMLGLAGNRTLLLLEEAGKQYLLNYSPAVYENLHRFKTQGFSEDRLQIFHCGDARKHFGKRNDGLESFSALLGRTKVVYLTNTLSQHDYERHIGERNERLRDFFVYDASLGSTIGPDIAQFFPYEVYKQVRYVFDKNQAKKQLTYRESFPELILPNTLRLRLRTELLAKQTAFTQQISLRWELPLLLGELCIASFSENLRTIADFDSSSLSKRRIEPQSNTRSILKELIAALTDIEKQFELGLKMKLLYGHRGMVNCVAALPGGRVVSGGVDHSLRVWDVTTGQCLQVLTGHTDWVTCVAVLPSGHVVSGSSDNDLRVWDPDTGQCTQILKGHIYGVNCVTILTDGRVVSGSSDHDLRVWDPNTGQCLQLLNGHSNSVYCVTNFVGGQVISGSRDKSIRIWDPTTGHCLQKLEGHRNQVTCVTVLNNGQVISGSLDKTLRVWDQYSGNCIWTCEKHTDAITCLAVLPDGRVVSGSDDHSLMIWDPNTGQNLQILDGHTNRVNCVSVFPSGQIVSGSSDGSLRVWDPDTGLCLQILEGNRNKITCMTILPDGQVVSGSQHDGAVAVSREVTLSAVWALENPCVDYIRFLNEKSDSLFSRFRKVDDKNYELSLEGLEKVQSFGETNVQTEDDSETLYQDLITFVEKYAATCKPTYTLDFDWGLSSGEENMLRLFSNLFHIFDRTDGGGRSVIYNNESHSDKDSEKTPCDSVLLFMDEADLTLHPEWQRRLISVLTAFLPQLYPASCAKDMQLILSTHSPLILGDIPSENITYLPSKKKTAEDRKRPIPEETFGQNIHTILKESFFLENGTVGDFAAKKINFIAQRLTEIEKQASSKESINHDPSEELKELQRLIHIIAPGVLHARLEQLYRAAEVAVNRRETAGVKTSVEKLLSDMQSLSKEQRHRLLEALNKERGADD